MLDLERLARHSQVPPPAAGLDAVFRRGQELRRRRRGVQALVAAACAVALVTLVPGRGHGKQSLEELPADRPTAVPSLVIASPNRERVQQTAGTGSGSGAASSAPAFTGEGEPQSAAPAGARPSAGSAHNAGAEGSRSGASPWVPMSRQRGGAAECVPYANSNPATHCTEDSVGYYHPYARTVQPRPDQVSFQTCNAYHEQTEPRDLNFTSAKEVVFDIRDVSGAEL
jgi:hypothetical protein